MGKGNWDIEEHVRKKDIISDPEVIKNLFLRVIERSLMDCTGASLTMTRAQVSSTQKGRLKSDSLRFLRSEWGQDICEFVNMDRKVLLKTAERYIEETKNGTYKKKYRGL